MGLIHRLHIFGRTDNFIVYLTGRKGVRYEFDDGIRDEVGPVVQRFNDLAVCIRVMRMGPDKLHAYWLLALATYTALLNRKRSPLNVHFREVPAFVRARGAAHARFLYVASGVVAAMALIGAASSVLWFGEFQSGESLDLALCAIGGALGAQTSLLQRASAVELDPYATRGTLTFLGLVRIALGITFGVLVVVLSKANLLAGVVSQSHWSIFAIAFVGGGFSERFVPDLLSKLENP